MKEIKSFTVLVFFSLCCAIEGYRILGLFPHPGRTHYAVFNPLMKGLSLYQLLRDSTVINDNIYLYTIMNFDYRFS